jgi:hypothetical protein
VTEGFSVTFLDAKDDSNVFSAWMQCCPRIGETVYYSHQADDQDQWNKESWDHSVALNGSEWTVVKVLHELRRYGVGRTAPVLFVTVRRKRNTGHNTAKVRS